MNTRPSPQPSLATRLSSLSHEQLRLLVERLAQENEAVAQRIDYLTRPTSAVQEIARRIRSIRADDRSLTRDSSRHMTRLLEVLAEDITRDVLPHEPIRALALCEALMALDEPLLERTHDDSGIQSALEDIATLWPKLARAVRLSGGLPLMDWECRLREVLADDPYALRSGMVQSAHLVLGETEQQRLRDNLTRDAARRARDREQAQIRWHGVGFRDVFIDLNVPHHRPLRSGSVNEAEPEATEVIEFLLDCGDVAEALEFLGAHIAPVSGPAPQAVNPAEDDSALRHARLDLLDRAYGQLGDTPRRIEVRRERYRLSPSLAAYRSLEALLDDRSREALQAEIRVQACQIPDPVIAAQLMLETGRGPLAQLLLLNYAKALAGETLHMIALAEQAEQRGYPLAATVVWRALLRPILKEGLSKSYRYGALYLAHARRLAPAIDDYKDLPTHEEYEADLRHRHRLKSTFWRQCPMAEA